jgi:hypothetical protein
MLFLPAFPHAVNDIFCLFGLLRWWVEGRYTNL